MGINQRPNIAPSNKYWISKHRYYELKHFCLQYKEWKAGLNALTALDKETGKISDPLSYLNTRKAALEQKIAFVDELCYEAEPEIAEYLLEAVTEGASFAMLQMKGMSCDKDTFYDRYRKFFWLLNSVRG